MKYRFSSLSATAFALVAVTVSSTAVIRSYAPDDIVLVPPMLGDGRLFTAQTAANMPINEFTAEEAALGIVLPADSHNFVTCDTGGSVATNNHNLGNVRTWMYEFTGDEPPFTGDFFISAGELSANSNLSTLNVLNTFNEGKRYYQMGAVEMYFQCGDGLSLTELCGNGTLEGNEQCDDGNTVGKDGCSSICTVEIGYDCTGEQNTCELLVPVLPSIIGSSTSSAAPTSSAGSSKAEQVPASSAASSTSNSADHAKITAITNANPDVNGTQVPTGLAAIGQFKFATGANDIVFHKIVFDIHAPNVALAASSFTIYDKADATKKQPCTTYYLSGDPFTGQHISGSFYVLCDAMPASNGDLDTTLVLEGSIASARLNTEKPSSLQVTLTNFTEPGRIFGVHAGESHIEWASNSQPFTWVDYPEATVKSTAYSS